MTLLRWLTILLVRGAARRGDPAIFPPLPGSRSAALKAILAKAGAAR